MLRLAAHRLRPGEAEPGEVLEDALLEFQRPVSISSIRSRKLPPASSAARAANSAE
jgi:hypothetical protein